MLIARPPASGAGRGPRSRRRGAGPAVSSPPCRAARSRMPISPSPPGAGGRTGRAAAVVGDLDLQLVRPVAQEDGGARRARVLERVGQRLLHDPVGRHVDGRRQRAPLALHVDVDRELRAAQRGRAAGRADRRPGRGARSSGSPAWRRNPSRRCSSVTAWRLEASIERQRRGRLRRLAVHHDPRRPGLDAHHADVVGDDVVQLARDPHPLVEHRPARVLLALALQRHRALAAAPRRGGGRRRSCCPGPTSRRAARRSRAARSPSRGPGRALRAESCASSSRHSSPMITTRQTPQTTWRQTARPYAAVLKTRHRQSDGCDRRLGEIERDPGEEKPGGARGQDDQRSAPPEYERADRRRQTAELLQRGRRAIGRVAAQLIQVQRRSQRDERGAEHHGGERDVRRQRVRVQPGPWAAECDGHGANVAVAMLGRHLS